MFTGDSESQLGRRRIANEVIAERKLPAIFHSGHSGIGSDFPLIAPERWMKDFDEAGFKPKVKPQILKDNAVRLLGLG
jgi:hypothetical protein